MKVFKSLLDSNQKKFSLEMKKLSLSHTKWLDNIMEVNMDSGHIFSQEKKTDALWDAALKVMVKKAHK